MVHDTSTGVAVARREVVGGSTAPAVSSDGRVLAVGGLRGDLERYEVAALLEGRPSLLTRASSDRGDAIVTLVFDEDTTALTGQRNVFGDADGSAQVIAWTADTDLRRLWALDTDLPAIDVHDGLLWTSTRRALHGPVPAAGSG